MIDIVVTEHIHELPGRSLCLRQINAERLPQAMEGQPLGQAGKLAPMRHHSSQRLGRERFPVAVDQDGLAAPVGRIQNLGEHRCDRHKKPFAASSSLVLGLNDIKPVEVTLDAIDEHTTSDSLIPAQARDVAAAVAEPKCQPVAGARCGAELPTLFKLLHGLTRPCFPAGIGWPPLDRCCGVDFDPVLPKCDIDQLAYADQ